MSATRFITGLDLGQVQDFTALVVVEQSSKSDTGPHPAKTRLPGIWPTRESARLAIKLPMVSHYAVRHMHRFQRGTAYPLMVDEVRGVFARPPLSGTYLVVDATGVGRPVCDLFRVAKPKVLAQISPWSITAGRDRTKDTVPKKDLVGAVQAVMGMQRLLIAPDLELAPVLAKEMETFRAKVTADRNETFSAWREKDHDDLLLALALAIWYGELLGPPNDGKDAVPMVFEGSSPGFVHHV